MSENKPANIDAHQEAEIARLRKIYVKNLWLNQALAFFILITTTFLFPVAVFLGFGLKESPTLGNIVFVICGIGGLLIGAASYMFIEERQRRNCIREFRASRKNSLGNETYRYV